MKAHRLNMNSGFRASTSQNNAPQGVADYVTPVRRRRRGLLVYIFSLLLSPAMAALLALTGYYVLALYAHIFFPDSSFGGILIRLGTLLAIFVAFVRFAKRRNGVRGVYLVPLVLFALAYIARVTQNYYFDEIILPFEPQHVFLIFISGIISAIALAQIQGAIRDEQFLPILTLLCLLFLGGTVLNIDELMASREGGGGGRIGLEKINPIPLAHTAFAFIIFYTLVFVRSRRYLIEAGFFVPALLMIVLYSGSRNAFVAGIFSISLYVLLLKGTLRVWMIVGTSVATLAIVMFLGGEHFDLMFDRLRRLTGESGISTDKSIDLHFLAWSAAFQQFLDNPLAGSYIIERVVGWYPHNIYLESLGAVGLLGSVPFLMHIMLACRAAIGIIRTPGFGTAAVFVAVLFFRDSIAFGSGGAIWSAPNYWVCSTLVIAFWYGYRRSIPAPSPEQRHKPVSDSRRHASTVDNTLRDKNKSNFY